MTPLAYGVNPLTWPQDTVFAFGALAFDNPIETLRLVPGQLAHTCELSGSPHISAINVALTALRTSRRTPDFSYWRGTYGGRQLLAFAKHDVADGRAHVLILGTEREVQAAEVLGAWATHVEPTNHSS